MKAKTKAIVEWKVPTVPDKKAIEKRSAPLLAQAADMTVNDEDHYVASWALVERHDAAIAKIEETFDPFVSGLHKLHKMACDMRADFLKPIVSSKNALLAKRQLYFGMVREAKRKADEAAAKAVQAAEKRELEKQAKLAEKQGDTQTAEVLREQSGQVPLQLFSSGPVLPKQEGSVIKERWVYEIVEPSKVEREYCSPDPKLIRPVVEALGPACKISGIKIERETKEHSRSVAS